MVWDQMVKLMRMHAHIRQADMSWGMGYKFEV